jgi:HD superfamily phosphodiesterase
MADAQSDQDLQLLAFYQKYQRLQAEMEEGIARDFKTFVDRGSVLDRAIAARMGMTEQQLLELLARVKEMLKRMKKTEK